MNKPETISKISTQTGISKEDTQIIIESMLQIIEQNLLKGGEVHFKGFGKFFNKKRSKKIARNMINNTAIIIDEHYVPALKFSKTLVDKVKKAVKIIDIKSINNEKDN